LSPRKDDPSIRLRLLVELSGLIDRLVAAAPPEKHKAIHDAGDRLMRAFVGDRAKAASKGRTARSEHLDKLIHDALVELDDAEKGRNRITFYTPRIAGKVYKLMRRRWIEAGKVGREPKLKTVRDKISNLKKEFPLTFDGPQVLRWPWAGMIAYAAGADIDDPDVGSDDPEK
jgi:hypothetical protein